jgi:hypothetical protein
VDNTIIQLFMNTQYSDLSYAALTVLFNDTMAVINAVADMPVAAYKSLFQITGNAERASRRALIKICERLAAWIVIHFRTQD